MNRLSSPLPILTLLTALTASAASAADLSVDCGAPAGKLRPLHGSNSGPLAGGGLTDLTAYHRELGIPFTRLHDCHWPNPDVVDIHAIFPDFRADPGKPESYDFRRTDEYLQAVLATGAQIVYRLGESIEHTPRKYHVNPPADPKKWAAICLGIIRHYNDGWAGGFRHGIRYWEIWNEPENRPAMWTGTDEQFLQLYETAATAIKARYPDLRVGGPSLGYYGKVENGRFEPSAFFLRFLKHCREKSAPLDFLSWHHYTDDPSECIARARGVRHVLDEQGFAKTESHFNEWNYLPNNDWKPMGKEGQGRMREQFYATMGGASGAAFTACVLTNLQDTPVDVSNYYTAEPGGFSMFSPHGTPHKAFYAIKAFRLLLDTPQRLTTRGGDPARLTIAAGTNETKTEVRILISNLRAADKSVQVTVANLPWAGATRGEVLVVDDHRELAKVRDLDLPAGEGKLTQELPAPAVCLIKLTGGSPARP